MDIRHYEKIEEYKGCQIVQWHNGEFVVMDGQQFVETFGPDETMETIRIYIDAHVNLVAQERRDRNSVTMEHYTIRYPWIRVVGEGGAFYERVERNRMARMRELVRGGYYAVPVPVSSVPPCRYRHYENGSDYFCIEESWKGGEDYYFPATDDEIRRMNALL